MAIIAPQTESTFKLIPAGVYPARCYSMVELGTQEIESMGKIKSVRQLLLSWELPLELEVFNQEKGLQPYSVNKTYNLSMYETANLRRDLESWRGKRFTEEEAKEFDITKLLGVPCQISIIHNVGKDGNRTYANINSITNIMKGIEVPDQINPKRLLEFSNFDWEVYKSLPDWLKEKITKSPEYKALAGFNDVQSQDESENIQEESKEPDDLPF